MTYSNKVNILLIGAGMHAERTYLKHARQLQEAGKYDVNIVAIIDVDEARASVEERLQKLGIDAPVYFLKSFSGDIPIRAEIEMNKILEEHAINAVIISTEPLSHGSYILWAIEHRLSFIVDKPITTRTNVVHKMDEASKLATDAEVIIERYMAATETSRFCGIVNSHRRWHPGFDYAMSLVEDIRDRFGCLSTAE